MQAWGSYVEMMFSTCQVLRVMKMPDKHVTTHPHLVARMINKVKLCLLTVQGHAHSLLAIFFICEENLQEKSHQITLPSVLLHWTLCT